MKREHSLHVVSLSRFQMRTRSRVVALKMYKLIFFVRRANAFVHRSILKANLKAKSSSPICAIERAITDGLRDMRGTHIRLAFDVCDCPADL